MDTLKRQIETSPTKELVEEIDSLVREMSEFQGDEQCQMRARAIMLKQEYLLNRAEREHIPRTLQEIQPCLEAIDLDLQLQIMVRTAFAYRTVGNIVESQKIFQEVERKFEGCESDELTQSRLDYSYFKGAIFERTGKLEEANRLIEEALRGYAVLKDWKGMARSEQVKGSLLMEEGESEQALEILKSSLGYSEKNNIITLTAYTHYLIGLLLKKQKKGRDALPHLEKAAKIYEELEISGHLAFVLNLTGVIYYDQLGEYLVAKEHFERVNRIYLKENAEDRTGAIMNNIGLIHEVRGELDLAEKYLNEAMKCFEKYNIQDGIEKSKYNLGKVYYKKNQMEKAIEFFSQSLDIAKKRNDVRSITYIHYYLMLIHLARNEFERAEYQYGILGEICNAQSDPLLEHIEWLCSGILRINSGKGNDFFESANFFRRIINDEVLDYEITISANKYLSHVLLKEYILFQRKEIFDKLTDIIDQLFFTAKERKIYPLMVETMIIMSKMRILEQDINSASEILHDAHKLIEEKSLLIYLETIEREKKILEETIMKWSMIVEGNRTILQRINDTKIEEYINRMVRS